MKYTVTALGEDIQVNDLRISPEEKENFKTAAENMARAAAAAMIEFARCLAKEPGQEKLIFGAAAEYLRIIADDFLNREENIGTDYPYEDMESEFLTWVYRQGYDDPFAFATEHDGRNLKVDFEENGEDITVFFSDESGEKYDVIGEIPSYLFADEPAMAAAYCLEYTGIAVLALDKLCGIENNSMRSLPPNDLEKRIKARIERE